MKHNGGQQEGARRSQDILAEIDRTRDEMDYTLGAIERRLTPGQLVDQGIDYLRQSGANEFVQNLAGQVKYHPLPVSLVGIGIAWLRAADKRQPAYGTESYAAGLGERAGQVKDKVVEGTQAMRDRATAATQSAKERIGALGSSARDQVDRAKRGMDYMVREQPLALGAVAVAIGAVLAAIAPRSRQEDELIGEASDRLKQQVKDTGQEKLEQATQAAKAATSTSKHGEPPTQKAAPKVGADLTPRGDGGTRRTS